MPTFTNAQPVVLTALILASCSGNEAQVRPDNVAPSTGTGGSAASGGSSAAVGGAAGTGKGGAAGDGQSGAAGEAGGSGGSSGAKHTCDAPRFGSPMVEIPSPSGTSYCMDTRPPSQKEYKQFLDAKKGDISGQDVRCADNLTYDIPESTGSDSEPFACPAGTFTPDKTPNKPVECVDFCDAAAYCAWAGKRLCGKIGGGDYPLDEGVKGVAGEWTNACSQGGKYELPTGEGTDPYPCKDSFDNGVDGCKVQTVPPYAELMTLGVRYQEWVDSCGPKDMAGTTVLACALSGVYVFATPKVGTPCNLFEKSNHLAFDYGYSFRCCAE